MVNFQAIKKKEGQVNFQAMVRVAKRDRSNKTGERELGVDTGWKVFLANQARPRICYKNRRRSRRLLRAPIASAGGTPEML
jgi:hypothetical protein